jgi:hypothetical protein
MVKDEQLIVLHSEGTAGVTHALIELHVVQDTSEKTVAQQSPGVQALLDKFSEVFDTKSGLPPRRQYDYQIPFPGTRLCP